MSGTDSENVKLCKQWYDAFKQRDLQALMALFTPDAKVTIGSGGSASAVDYAGSYEKARVKDHYEKRFADEDHTAAPLRPECIIIHPPCEFGPWVVFSGNITDTLKSGKDIYRGAFLHVWTIDAAQKKIAALEMHLEPSGRL